MQPNKENAAERKNAPKISAQDILADIKPLVHWSPIAASMGHTPGWLYHKLNRTVTNKGYAPSDFTEADMRALASELAALASRIERAAYLLNGAADND